VLFSRWEDLGPVHGRAEREFGGHSISGMALAAGGSPAGARPVGTRGGGDEIGQQPSGAPRNMGLLVIPSAAEIGAGSRAGSLFDHPAGEERQGRLFHHLLEEDGKLPAKIRHMFQFGHLKISQRRARTFPQIVHRRFAEPCHELSPETDTAISAAALLRGVTDFHISTSTFSPVETPGGLGVENDTYPTPPAGSLSSRHVQRLLW